MAPEIKSVEGICNDEFDDLIESIKETCGDAQCGAHAPIAAATIKILRVCKVIMSYLESPVLKIVVSLVTLGGGGALLLAALKLYAFMKTGVLVP